MNSFKIDRNLYKEIEAYVKLNELGDVDLYINNLLKESFTIKKYDKVFDIGKTIKVGAKTVKVEEDKPIKLEEVKKENIEEIKKEEDLYGE